MQSMPQLFLPMGMQQVSLYEGRCVNVVMDEKMRQLTITARAGSDVDAGCAIDGIIKATDALLSGGREYSVVWNLHDAPTPRYRDVMRLASWGMRNKAELERLTSKMEIVMREGAVASIAGALLSMYARVPTTIVSDASELDGRM